MEVPSGQVLAPGGLYAEQNHHSLAEGEKAHLDEHGGVVKISQGREVELPPPQSVSSLMAPQPGWVTFANWMHTSPPNIRRISGSWSVPEPPATRAGQVIFLHLGLKSTFVGQPVFAPAVLQWGKTPFGGGEFWTIACWLQAGAHIFVGNYEEVSPGDVVTGEVAHSNAGGRDLWTVSATSGGKNASLSLTLAQPLDVSQVIGGALEAYGDNMQCAEYPASVGTSFGGLVVLSDQGPLTPHPWKVNDVVQDCGQQTVVRGDSRVDIFFRSPAQESGGQSAGG